MTSNDRVGQEDHNQSRYREIKCRGTQPDTHGPGGIELMRKDDPISPDRHRCARIDGVLDPHFGHLIKKYDDPCRPESRQGEFPPR